MSGALQRCCEAASPRFADVSPVATKSAQPTTIKKYPNRRLYNTNTAAHVTLEDLAEMVEADEDFLVYDANTGNNITRAVVMQMIVHQESNRYTPGEEGLLRKLRKIAAQ
jgi:polyhydroxyalkanoate synthesis regulator protein